MRVTALGEQRLRRDEELAFGADAAALLRRCIGQRSGLLALGVSALAATANTELRLATMARPNTPWMDLPEQWADNVAENSGGELTVSIYH